MPLWWYKAGARRNPVVPGGMHAVRYVGGLYLI